MNEDKTDSPPGPAALYFQMHGLRFEQQKDFVADNARQNETWFGNKKKQLELERIHQQAEKSKLDLEDYRLSLIKDGLLSCEDQGGQMPRPFEYCFDVNNLCLLPCFKRPGYIFPAVWTCC